MQDFRNLSVWQMARGLIAEDTQERILDVLIQVKRMLGGLLGCLGWSKSGSVERETSTLVGRLRQGPAAERDGTDS
jgi:hypothetical protein